MQNKGTTIVNSLKCQVVRFFVININGKSEFKLICFGGNTMKKIITSLLTIITLCLCLVGCGKPASSPVEDFVCKFEDGEATIIGYTGTDLDIVIPETINERPVKYIGFNEETKNGAFEGYDMQSIVIPEGVKMINEYAFSECKMLEIITFPDSMQGFYYNETSKNMTSGICALDETKWYQNQDDGILYIDNVLVGVKGNLSGAVDIKDGTASILSNAFEGQDNITSVSIPNSVKYIGKFAFRNCDLLKELNVPDGTVIGVGAFSGIIKGNFSTENTNEE